MNDKYILDDLGMPVLEPDLYAWGRWFETAERHVAQVHLGDVTISTVFLGLDHSWGGGPPLIFETMVFGGPHDGYQERYSTRTEALMGHALAVRLAMGGTTE
jgi:hypothetical protein